MLGVLVAFHRLILSIKRWGGSCLPAPQWQWLPSAGRQRAPHTPVREMLLERRVLWSSLGEEMQATLPSLPVTTPVSLLQAPGGDLPDSRDTWGHVLGPC